MATEDTEVNEIRVRAPDALAEQLAGAGFKVELVITRATEHPDDPDLLLPHTGEPFSTEDKANIEALTSQYEVGNEQGDQGPPMQPTAPIGASASPAPDERRDTGVVLLTAVAIALKTLEGSVLNAHWRIRGPEFVHLHPWLGEYADALRKYADRAAERVSAMGGQAPAVPAGHEMPTAAGEICTTLLQMTTDAITTLGQARQHADAEKMLDTFDLLTGIMRALEEKWGWALASMAGQPAALESEDVVATEPAKA